MSYEYLYKKQTKEQKSNFIKKFNKIAQAVKNDFSVYIALVGSSKRNLILVNVGQNHQPQEKYDFDYQLIITNSKNQPLNEISAQEIKEYFRKQFEKEFKKESKFWKAHDSTTSITLNNENLNYSFDIVICSWVKQQFQVIKRNNEDYYVWNQLKDYSSHRRNVQEIKRLQLWPKVRELYKTKKYIARKNQNLTASYLLFIETAKEVIDVN